MNFQGGGATSPYRGSRSPHPPSTFHGFPHHFYHLPPGSHHPHPHRWGNLVVSLPSGTSYQVKSHLSPHLAALAASPKGSSSSSSGRNSLSRGVSPSATGLQEKESLCCVENGGNY